MCIVPSGAGQLEMVALCYFKMHPSTAALHMLCCAVLCRFVEDNWESPVLGAWGLGWEVWLDGMEVTQFTYFQQVGGLLGLSSPAVTSVLLPVALCVKKVIPGALEATSAAALTDNVAKYQLHLGQKCVLHCSRH
jgi:hypothetical protein